MDALAEELRRALRLRSEALLDHIVTRRARLGRDNPAARVLEIAERYPHRLLEAVDRYWERNSDPLSRVQLLRRVLKHTSSVVLLVENRLARDAYAVTPPYIFGSLQRMCDSMNLKDCVAILSVGDADIFDSGTVEIEEQIFGRLQESPTDILDVIKLFLRENCNDLPERFDSKHYISISAPRMESQSLLWMPIMLGHELAHSIITPDTVKDLTKVLWFDDPEFWRNASEFKPLVEMATSWTVELTCDAYAFRTYGVCGIAALAEFLEVTNQINRVSLTHPPGRLRIELMLKWLAEEIGNEGLGILSPIVEPWRHYSDPLHSANSHVAKRKIEKTLPPAIPLIGTLLSGSRAILSRSKGFPGTDYDYVGRSSIVDAVKADLEAGMPCDIKYRVEAFCDGSNEDVESQKVNEADIVTGAWLARSSGIDSQYIALSKKSLEIADFVGRWKDTGTSWHGFDSSTEPDDEGSHVDGTVLAADGIRRRMNAGRDCESRLVVRPYEQSFLKDASLDVRLGNQFIVFVRSGISSFDPLVSNYDPKSMQRLVQLSWGEQFVLHPGEMVLASTLEYLVLPHDLTAQVITRSSYGRLGLLSATAIQVQPHYHGCLTLELVNLGTVPLELTPGQRIAQLVFLQTVATPRSDDLSKYHCTVGPEFSRIHQDKETHVLRQLRDSLQMSSDPLPD